METSRLSWLSELPNEILLEIFDNLNRIHLFDLVRVNKRIHALAQYVLEHKKKIRLCGDNLRVLVLSLPTEHDIVALDPDMQQARGSTRAPRAALLACTVAYGPTKRVRFQLHTIAHTCQVANGGKNRRLTMIVPPNEKRRRKELWIHSVAADLLLFVVDPKEIDEHSEEIKEIVFGSCFMMSARNVIVAVDLHNYPTESLWSHPFNQAKAKLATLLDKTVGMCYKIVPVNVKTGLNITPELTSFGGPPLMQLILEDQLRTNFDEGAFQKLCEVPLKVQLRRTYRIGGIGTVAVGRVISGVLRPGTIVAIHPNTKISEVSTIEEYHEDVREAKPGSVVGFNIRRMSTRDVPRRFSYVVNQRQTQSVNCTYAFRASIFVMRPDRFAQHQTYTVFYGTARIHCILWWIFPEDGKNHDKNERKFKLEYKDMPVKPNLNNYYNGVTRKNLKKEYKIEVAKARERHVKLQAEKGKDYVRPPKPTLRKAKAIILPLIHYDIETYKPSAFEKNYSGKVMLVEKGSIVGVGRVDRVLSYSAGEERGPRNQDYREQYAKVVDQASGLFTLPTEQKQLDLFLDHIKNNKHARNCIQEQRAINEWR